MCTIEHRIEIGSSLLLPPLPHHVVLKVTLTVGAMLLNRYIAATGVSGQRSFSRFGISISAEESRCLPRPRLHIGLSREYRSSNPLLQHRLQPMLVAGSLRLTCQALPVLPPPCSDPTVNLA